MTERRISPARSTRGAVPGRLSDCPGEVCAWLEACHVLLHGLKFSDMASEILATYQKLLNAERGYVLLQPLNREHNECLYIETGKQKCPLSDLVTDLRQDAHRLGRPTYRNDFSADTARQSSVFAEVKVTNAILAPLRIADEWLGELVLAGKPGGFSERDACCAAAFADLVAVGLQNGYREERLEAGELLLQAVMQAANDAIICADETGTVFLWNVAAERMFGYRAAEVCGQPLDRIMPDRFRDAHRMGMERLRSTGQSRLVRSTTEVFGLRRDGTEFPLELSLAVGRTAERPFFAGILRDITQRKDADQALQQQRDLTKTVFSTLGALVILLDRSGRILDFNPACQQLTGYSLEEVRGRVFSDLFVTSAEYADVRQVFERLCAGQFPLQHENDCLSRDGSRYRILWSNTAILGTDGRVECVIGTGIDITERRRAESALQQTLAELEQHIEQRTSELAATNAELRREIAERQRLEREILELTAAEQQRIGRELHDGLGQELTGLSYLATSLQQKLAKKGIPEAAIAGELSSGIPRVLAQIQNVCRGLVSWEVNAEQLIPAIQSLATLVEEQTDIACHCEIAPQVPITDDRLAVQLYRIVQEALTNSMKHARPHEIAVILRFEAAFVVLEVHDDGIGIDLSDSRLMGAGIRIMEYRARTLGGVLSVAKREGGGTSVVCRIPTGQEKRG